MLMWSRRLLLVTLFGLLSGGCGSTPDDASATDGIRIGSFDFSESEIVAELYAQVLEENGLPVVRLGVVGPREILAPAIEGGLLDVVPEYSGTAAQHFATEIEADPASTIDEALARRGLVMLDPAAAENVNVFVVTAETAATHQLTQISDLSSSAAGLRLGGPAECRTRPLCLVGLFEVYGLDFVEFIPQSSLEVTAEALLRNEIDVGVMFSTAAELLSDPLVVLEDDRDLQPDEHISPLVRAEALEQWGPTLADALNQLSKELSTSEMGRLNQRVADGTPIVTAVSEWLARTSRG